MAFRASGAHPSKMPRTYCGTMRASRLHLKWSSSKDPKDFVTLDEALAKLHEMQSAGLLGSRDKDRLQGYEEMAKTHAGSEVLVPRQRTFTLIRNRITVRDLLD